MIDPIISVITPCYNQSRFIRETIESVISQTYKNWEMIIVDDGSEDNLLDVVSHYTMSYPNIHIVRQDNSGPSKARNLGASLSKGKYLLFLDGDDIIEPIFVEQGVLAFEKDNDCSLFYSRTDFFGDERGLYDVMYSDYKSLLLRNSIVCCCMVKKIEFERISGFDESMKGFEDWEFFIRLLYHSGSVCQSEKVLFHYRKTTKAVSVNSAATTNRDRLTLYIFKKNIEKYFEYFENPQQLMAGSLEKEKQLQWYIQWCNRFPMRVVGKVLRFFDRLKDNKWK